MTKYREILRLKSLGLSQQSIADSCNVSKKTVNRVLKRAKELNISWPLDKSDTDAVLAEMFFPSTKQTSVYKGYKQDKIEMRGDRAEMSDFPLYLNTVAGGLDRRDQTIGGFSFVVKIYAVPVVEIIG